MKTAKKCFALFLVLALVLSLCGCSKLKSGFVDYDVSGYIQALLDSSYHGDSQALMDTASMTEEQVRQYNATTVENAAVIFCNTYEVAPSEGQLEELQKIMRQAFSLTKYTVKEERCTDTGYYLEVEVAPITNFAGREAEILQLKEKAREELTPVSPVPSTLPEISSVPEDDDDDEGEEDEGDEEDGSESSQPEEPPVEEKPAGPNEEAVTQLFVEKVLAFCRQELANIHYDPEIRIVALDILLTGEGELQLDLDQIETIDKTVVLFKK